MGDYENAIIRFVEYTGMKRKDPVGWSFLGLSYLHGRKDLIKAKECLDKALGLSPDNTDTIECMSNYHIQAGNPEKSEELYRNALGRNPDNYVLLCDAAEMFSRNGKYEEALSLADRAIAVDETGIEAYRVKADAHYWNGDTDKGEDAIEAMLSRIDNSQQAYYTAAEYFYNDAQYKLAQEYYEKVIALNPHHENAYVGKIASLFYRKRYSACLLIALETEKKFKNKDIEWFIADTYSALHNRDNAILYYKKALEGYPGNTQLLVSLGWEQFYRRDFNEAVVYADKALEKDTSHYNAKDLKDTATKRLRNVAAQICEFIETNYMHYKASNDYESLGSAMKEKSNVKPQEISKLFTSVHQKGDQFSFVLGGDEYKAYQEMCEGSTIEYRPLEKNVHYVRITGFTESTSNDFLNIVDNITKPENAYLVIDLRDNGGGDTNSGCNILDFLLPDCVVCNLIYKDGYSRPYYSDEERIPFRHIYILADENSASCAELVTLGLKTYLGNVTVIGRNTFGKGVGQIVYDEPSMEFAVFIVNHYWNVREVNIMEKGIQPDVAVKGSSLDDFMNEVYKSIDAMQ